jgi:glycerol-3-phosphate dehydrogenase
MGRNRDLPPTSILAGGRILSRRECRQLLPGLPDDRITGAALWYDAQLSDPEALVRGFAGAASALGANVADRAEAEELTVQAGAVTGAWVRDRITGERHSVRARVVIVAAGPWSGELVRRAADRSVRQPVRHALALNLVLSRRVAETAVGLISHRGRAEDPVGGGRRILFLVPQSQGALLGTWYGLVPPHEEAVALERGAQMLLEDINREWPGAGIGPGDVIGRLWGRLPLKEGYESGRRDALAERALLQDHRREGLANLLSVESVKLTTARAVAERVLDRVLAMLGERPRPCRTREVRLPGAAQTESAASAPVPTELQFTSRVEAEGRETIG